MPTYAFPANNQTARGASSVLFNGAFTVPDWRKPQLAAYNPTTSGITVSGFANMPSTGSVSDAIQISTFMDYIPYSGTESLEYEGQTLTGEYFPLTDNGTDSISGDLSTGWLSLESTQETGYVACVASSGTVWALGYGEGLLAYSPSGSMTWALPFGETFCGIVLQTDVPYFLSTNGTLYTIANNVITQAADFGATCSGLQASGSVLYALSGTNLLSLDLSSGTTSSIAIPMTYPANMAATSGLIGITGTDNYSVDISANAFVYLPLLKELFAAQTSANEIQVLTKNSVDDWTVSQTVSGVGGDPSFMAVLSNAEQLLVSNPTNNILQIVPETDGVWGSGTAQSLSVTDASALVVTPDNTTALVCQPSQNQVGVFTETNGVWASGYVIAVTGAQSIVLSGSDSGYCGGTSGITNLILLNGSWQSSGSISTSFSVESVAVDSMGGLYAAGSNGSTGYLEVYFNGVAVGGASWTGNAKQVAWYEGQILVLDTVNNLLRIFGLVNGSYSQQTQLTAPTNTNAFVELDVTWFIGANQLYQYEWGAPYTFQPAQTGLASIYSLSSATWATYAIGRSQRPFAATFDDSGNLWVASDGNMLYAIASDGSLVSSNTIDVYPGQIQTTPLGISSLKWWNGVLYGSSCLNDAIAVGL